MSLLTVVIPSADPRFLPQTVDDLFAKAAGPIEVIVSADGYDPQLPPRPGLTVLVHARLGMRGALNAARPHVRGDYVAKSDEHCLFGPGFDEVLKADYQPGCLLIPRRYSLDAENWRIENNPKGPRDYHFLTSCVWSIRERHDYSLNGYEWPARTRERLVGYDVDETMSWQGSFYFADRAHWEWLGPMQEEGYGSFASEPQEIGLKTQLAGGKLLVTKHTYYAHLHKGKKYGRGYRPNRTEIAVGHEYSAWYWMSQPGMRDFIARWWPVPTWPADTLERWDEYFPPGATLEHLKAAALRG
jgi:hypothetical protein